MRLIALLLAGFAPALAAAQDAAAPAADAAAMAPGSPLASLAPLVLIFVVFYFLLIKPQQKRMKEHQVLLGGLKKGDEVVTAGGIIGKITKVNADDSFAVEIASGVEVRVLKSTISGLHGVVPVATEKKKSADKKNDNAAPSRDAIANDN